jgi:hypothetical protein
MLSRYERLALSGQQHPVQTRQERPIIIEDASDSRHITTPRAISHTPLNQLQTSYKPLKRLQTTSRLPALKWLKDGEVPKSTKKQTVVKHINNADDEPVPSTSSGSNKDVQKKDEKVQALKRQKSTELNVRRANNRFDELASRRAINSEDNAKDDNADEDITEEATLQELPETLQDEEIGAQDTGDANDNMGEFAFSQQLPRTNSTVNRNRRKSTWLPYNSSLRNKAARAKKDDEAEIRDEIRKNQSSSIRSRPSGLTGRKRAREPEPVNLAKSKEPPRKSIRSRPKSKPKANDSKINLHPPASLAVPKNLRKRALEKDRVTVKLNRKPTEPVEKKVRKRKEPKDIVGKVKNKNKLH